jgi:hypothetical protein
LVKVRDTRRVISHAVVIGVTVSREREVLGLDVGPIETGAFWSAFLRSLVARGLTGVRLVVTDAHRGLKMAIESILQGASWQCCRTHTIRTQSPDLLVSGCSDGRNGVAKWDHVANLQRILADDDDEPTCWASFPTRQPLCALVGSVLAEQHEEWRACRYFNAESLAELTPAEEVQPVALGPASWPPFAGATTIYIVHGTQLMRALVRARSPYAAAARRSCTWTSVRQVLCTTRRGSTRAE